MGKFKVDKEDYEKTRSSNETKSTDEVSSGFVSTYTFIQQLMSHIKCTNLQSIEANSAGAMPTSLVQTDRTKKKGLQKYVRVSILLCWIVPTLAAKTA